MKTFQTSRTINASPELLFEAIARAERLAKWWGPHGFTNTFNHFEFKPGGKWSFVMHGPDGTNYPNESEFVEIIPPQKVVIRHACQPFFTLSILIEESANGSVLHWIQEFDSEEVAEMVASVVIPGNEQNIDRLIAEVNCINPLEK